MTSVLQLIVNTVDYGLNHNSYSVGANYRLSGGLAVFARASRTMLGMVSSESAKAMLRMLGAPPHVTYTAVTRIPNDMQEYDVAGALGHDLENDLSQHAKLQHQLGQEHEVRAVFTGDAHEVADLLRELLEARDAPHLILDARDAGLALAWGAHTFGCAIPLALHGRDAQREQQHYDDQCALPGTCRHGNGAARAITCNSSSLARKASLKRARQDSDMLSMSLALTSPALSMRM